MEYEQKWNFYQLLKLGESTPISKPCHGHVTINHQSILAWIILVTLRSYYTYLAYQTLFSLFKPTFTIQLVAI